MPEQLALPKSRQNIAIIGSGISGLSAAWLLSHGHDITVFEAANRLGGHANTVDAEGNPVDTGFMVYNEATYPNFTALLNHFQVATKPTAMSFAVSLDAGRLEYSASGLNGLFAQKANLLRPRHWSMLNDILRFFRQAPRDLGHLGTISLDEYLRSARYGFPFKEDFLYPMAAAIWSTPASLVGAYPAQSLIRFCQNHGLLQAFNQPIWRTVSGGSKTYVEKLMRDFAGKILLNRPVRAIKRVEGSVVIDDGSGENCAYDHVVIATHADQALRILGDASTAERQLLGAFRYNKNRALLHKDTRCMPHLRNVWSSWNYFSESVGNTKQLSVTYWMNSLQHIPASRPRFVTLNPLREPDSFYHIHEDHYEHPLFDANAILAQRELWSLQGHRNTWFCGAHFGAGFHEDGLQAGLAVAEALGGMRRPWNVPAESGRIFLNPEILAHSWM